MEMRGREFLVRITQIYQYHPDNVQLGAQLLNFDARAHRVVIITTQDKLNMEPRPGQQWKILKEDNYSVRQELFGGDKYVNVYRFTHPILKCVMPDNSSSFVTFLNREKSFKGIGKVSSQVLWDTFRSDIFKIIECPKDAPYKHDNTVTNFDVVREVLISEKAVHGLWDGYKDYANLKLAEQLVKYGIEEPIQRQLFRICDQEAIKFLKQNPYRLFSLGMQFQKVDTIAQKHFGIKKGDDLRVSAVVEQALRLWSDNGNTVADWQNIEPVVRKLLDNDPRLVSRAKELKCDIIGVLKKDDKYFALGNYIIEKTIAKRFKRLSKIKGHWLSEVEYAFTSSVPSGWCLEQAQERAIRIALTSHIFALAGGAGTGKTATMKVIVDAYKKLGFSIYPVALSGKAARRLQQSIGIETSTIARLLSKQAINEKHCVLLVDEASMLDAYTMWRLITLFSDRTRILLIGDPAQLPPINAGLVLKDAIQSGVINYVELDVVKRQGAQSSIPAYSNAIRKGRIPPSLSTADVIFQETKHDMLQEAVDAYSKYRRAMIVASTSATVRSVNNRLQSEVNPNGKILNLTDMPIIEGRYEFREGDPVVVTLTSYKNNVQNGTLGVIKHVVPTEEFACVVELEDLDENGNKRILKVNWQLFGYLELAYCLTLHKLQGSQAENVIIILERGLLLDRSWLYTAVTRAEDKVHIIGRESDFLYGIKKKGATDTRKTALLEMLKND